MTFSPCFKILTIDGQCYWVTNWTQVFELDDIEWGNVVNYVVNSENCVGFGYVFSKGHNSRNVTSKRNRVEVWVDPSVMVEPEN